MGIYNRVRTEDHIFKATSALASYHSARDAMLRSSIDMLAFSQSFREVGDRQERARYDRQHKKMLRLLSAWGRLEHEREQE